MRFSFTSWDACRNTRRHETSRALACAGYSIRRTELLKSRSFQDFAPSPDKIRIRKHSLLLPLSGACYNCHVRVGAERDAFLGTAPAARLFPCELITSGRSVSAPSTSARAGPGPAG